MTKKCLVKQRTPKTLQLSETTAQLIGRVQDEPHQLAAPLLYHSCNTRKATVDAHKALAMSLT
jgi:hypothetical protein